MKTTCDKLLNGRFTALQPKDGYRIAVDTLLLASAVPARAGQKVLELGCGVGGVMMALACRVPELTIAGIEIQPELAALGQDNIRRNASLTGLSLEVGDVAHLPEAMQGAFDHVVMNPPFHDPRKQDASPNACKRKANTENPDADLGLWLLRAAWALREGGMLTLIHRADRAPEIIDLLSPHFGEIRVKPILTKPENPARRVIVRAQKGSKTALLEEPPLVLHQADGAYSAAAELILREAQAL